MVRLNAQTREEYTKQIIQAIDMQNLEQFRELFFDLHPTDQVDVFNSLTKKQRDMVYQYIDANEFSEIFEELEIEKQTQYIEELPETYTTDVLNHMPDDDLVDFLGLLPEETKDFYLSKMDKEEAQEVIQLLEYEEQTAGAIMTTEFVAISSTETVQNVLEMLRKEAPAAETIYYLYVVNKQEKLVGVVSLRELIAAPLNEKIDNMMLTRIKYVETSSDQEDVARIMKKYDFLALPVVAAEKLVGIITIDDIMDVVEEETEEDFAEIVGGKGTFDENISSFSAARKRAPWIVLLLFFGMVKGGIIGVFEDTLEQYIMLAAFIPLIMDSAGNTGTQALAVVVRSFAVEGKQRTSIRKIMKREFGIGVVLGLICAVALLIIVPLMFPEGGLILAGIVGVSLILTLCVATVVGAMVPFLAEKLKLDPAVASGPFITTINDVLGLVIYFAIATRLLDYLI